MSHLLVSQPSHLYKSPHRGIALLVTLVILALLAVFMTEFSFETKLETRGIQNYQASFKARNAVKSMFKAVLEGLKGQNEVKFFRIYLQGLQYNFSEFSGNDCTLLNPCKPVKLIAGVIADFPDVIFYTPYIRPIDHLFNLNRIRKNNPGTPEDLDLHNQFVNILKNMKSLSGQVSLGISSIDRIYAALFDWTDGDQEPYEMIGIEHYQDLQTEYEIKNQKLDKLSEILLIDGIAESGIPLDNSQSGPGSWKNYFTVFPVENRADGFEQPRINVNLATENEIVDFLMQFENQADSSTSQTFIAKAIEIGSTLKLITSGEKGKTYHSSSEIQKSLDSSPATSDLPVVAKQFFIPYSNWYEINLKTEIDNVQAEVNAFVSVVRNPDHTVEKLIIHEFLLR